MPAFHEYASAWLEAKIAGTIGDRPIDVNTQSDYRWRLTKHLLPYFSKYRLDAIDAAACQVLKAKKLNEAAELRAAIDAGADVRDKSGKRARPLGPASIRKLITCLAAILDEAIEDGHIERNPARGARMRIRVPKPPRTFLEMDELVALIDAAGEQDRRLARVARERLADKDSTAAKVAALLAEGKRTGEIAKELGRAKSTIGWHIKRLGVEGSRDYVGRRAIVAVLGGGGLRASELCDVRLGEVRPARSRRRAAANSRRQDRGRGSRRRTQSRPRRRTRRARRSSAPCGPVDQSGEVPLPACPRRADEPPARVTDRQQGRRAGERATRCAGTATAAEHDPP
jgi:integrase